MWTAFGTLGFIANIVFGLYFESMVNIFIAGVMVPGLADGYCDIFKRKSKEK